MTLFGYELPSVGEIGNLLLGLAALFGAHQAWQAKRQTKATKVAVTEVASKVDDVQRQTNGITAELQVAARKEGRLEKTEEIAAGDTARADKIKDAITDKAIADMAAKPIEPSGVKDA